MNIRDLITKLETIAEADDARAQYDKFKADDAKAGAIAQVKKMLAPNGSANFIDPKDGVIKWQETMRGDSGGNGDIREFPFAWYKKGQNADFFNILKAAGLEVIPVDRKMLFGTDQVAGVDPAKLATLGQEQAPAPAPDNKPDVKQDPKGNDDANKLAELVAKLEALLTGEGPMPSPTTTTTTTATTTPEKTLGQKAGIGAGIGAGALAGGALGKKFGGAKGAALGALTGGALGGMGINALQKENADARLVKNEFNEWELLLADGTNLIVPAREYTDILEAMTSSNASIASSLVESFEYEVYEDARLFYLPNGMLVEYSWDQFKGDAGDFGRGAWNGVTLGAGDNIAAGVKSAFGSGTYKDELAKQTAASKEAEQRSPWLYGAGNVAGSLAVPVPGGAIAGGLIKGASTAAKVARGGTALGINLAAQHGVDTVKQASDTKTLGYDPTQYPTTPQAVKAFQQANGLTPDGIAGPKTQAVLAKMGLTPPKPATVAEDIKSIAERLAMIESGPQDYQVWLLEDGTVIGEQGEVITNQEVMDAVNWGKLGTGAMDLIKGAGKNIASIGSNVAGGIQQKAPAQMRNAGKFAGFAPGAKIANKVGGVIGRNPGKAALATLGVGGLAGAALAGGSAAAPAGTTTGGGSSGGSSTGGSSTGGSSTGGSTATPGKDNSADIAALVKQINDLRLQHGEDETPDWVQATTHAQAVVDKATKASKEQTAADVAADNATAPATASAPTGSSAAAPAGAFAANNPQATMKESEDELARWLKIARG